MDRKEFIKTCSYSCVGLLGIQYLFNACTPVKTIQATPDNTNSVTVLLSEFRGDKKNSAVLVKTSAADYPIIVYKISEQEYAALLLQCSHQGVELTVNGNVLSCTAHGSEFNNKGEVLQGPAERGLRRYKVTLNESDLKIHLT